jgi:hypothetical protein
MLATFQQSGSQTNVSEIELQLKTIEKLKVDAVDEFKTQAAYVQGLEQQKMTLLAKMYKDAHLLTTPKDSKRKGLYQKLNDSYREFIAFVKEQKIPA